MHASAALSQIAVVFPVNIPNGLIRPQCCSWLNSKIFLPSSPPDHCHSSPRAASSCWLIKAIHHSSPEHWPVIVVSWSGDRDTRNMFAYYKLLGAGEINCWGERLCFSCQGLWRQLALIRGRGRCVCAAIKLGCSAQWQKNRTNYASK